MSIDIGGGGALRASFYLLTKVDQHLIMLQGANFVLGEREHDKKEAQFFSSFSYKTVLRGLITVYVIHYKSGSPIGLSVGYI